jgi:hypothetical protein
MKRQRTPYGQAPSSMKWRHTWHSGHNSQHSSTLQLLLLRLLCWHVVHSGAGIQLKAHESHAPLEAYEVRIVRSAQL